MAFLNDLDGFAWAATIVATVACCLVTLVDIQDWLDHRRIDVTDGRTTLVTVCAIAFLVGALSSYSPDANAPRKSVQGVARFVAKVNGRHSFNEYICATSCQLTGGYALDLRDRASNFVQIGSPYVFTYLEKPVGGALDGVSLRAIAISDPNSGQVLYALDLTNHPWRIVLYLCDTALVVGAGLLGGLFNRTRRLAHAEEVDEDEGEEEVPRGEGPISLGLESKDGD
jgi:hypothetical protein